MTPEEIGCTVCEKQILHRYGDRDMAIRAACEGMNSLGSELQAIAALVGVEYPAPWGQILAAVNKLTARGDLDWKETFGVSDETILRMMSVIANLAILDADAISRDEIHLHVLEARSIQRAIAMFRALIT